MKKLILLSILFISFKSYATCSGSGVSWSCTSATTPAQINTVIGSASSGAVVTFATGAYTWNSSISFNNSKALTLICASVRGCTVTATGISMGLNGTCAGTNTNLYRVSGFVFNGGGNIIWYNAFNQGSAGCTMTKIRVDHNTFSNQTADSRILMFGDNSNNSYFYGVVDHNIITNGSNLLIAEFYASDGTGAPSGTRGTANNMVFEDNTMTITTMDNAGAGCMDSTGSPSVVWRYNTTTNCLVTAHGSTGGGGIVNYEVYKNTFIVNSGATSAGFDDCGRCFHHQGSGETLLFDNVFTQRVGASHAGSPMGMTHYRSATPAAAGYSGSRCDGTTTGDGNRSGQLGYPCKRQPGRDTSGILHPIYVWQNRWADNGALATMDIENPWGATNPSVQDHIQADRDYYNAVSANAQTSTTSPFNGTTGMGFGTLANRPSTCTATPQSADAGHGGVGYFATDVGNWDGFTGHTQGILYTCTSTNTWSQYYIPYIYPHPLVVQSGPQSPTIQ